MVVYINSTGASKCKPGITGELCLRPYADTHDHHFCINDPTAGELYVYSIIHILKGLYSILKIKLNSFCFYMLVYYSSHFEIKRSNNMIRKLHDSYLYALGTEILSNLKANEACSYDHSGGRFILIHKCFYLISVRYISKSIYSRRINSFKPWLYRLSSGRQYKLVIAYGIASLFSLVIYLYCFFTWIYCCCFTINSNIYPETPAHAFGR